MSFVIPEVSITFAGCGSFFATPEQYQSNMVIEAKYPGGVVKRLLFDCGTDAKFSLSELGYKPSDFEAVYISHQHGDHMGGLEWLAFGTYFTGATKPRLVCDQKLMEELWETGLKGAMSTLQGKTATLSEYFCCCAVPTDGYFFWANTIFSLVQTIHVCSGFNIKYSYGLMMSPAVITNHKGTAFMKRGQEDVVLVFEHDEGTKAMLTRAEPLSSDPVEYEKQRRQKVFITGDTRFDDRLTSAYDYSKLIFHDCETAPYKSGVHASYADLCTLPEDTKKKIMLYHYQPTDKDAVKDGFMGFAQKGQKMRLW